MFKKKEVEVDAKEFRKVVDHKQAADRTGKKIANFNNIVAIIGAKLGILLGLGADWLIMTTHSADVIPSAEAHAVTAAIGVLIANRLGGKVLGALATKYPWAGKIATSINNNLKDDHNAQGAV